MLWLLLLIGLIYAGMLYLLRPEEDDFQDDFEEAGSVPASRPVSVLLCVRNEAPHVLETVHSLLDQDYAGRYGVRVFDDFSEDGTGELVRAVDGGGRLEVYGMGGKMDEADEGSHKKQAIEWGVEMAEEEYILVADGDTVYPRGWVSALAGAMEAGADMAGGPVLIREPQGVLGHFQAMEALAIQSAGLKAARKGWFYTASGANMGFRRRSFEEVGGYEGNRHIGSGDDIFLLRKMQRAGRRIRFLGRPEAMVRTQAAGSWKELLWQRVRWGAKARHYPGGRINLPWFIAGLFNAFLAGGLLIALAAGLAAWLAGLAVAWAFKAGMEYWFTAALRRRAGYRTHWPAFVVSAFAYPFFLSAVALAAAFSPSLSWKGRKVKS